MAKRDDFPKNIRQALAFRAGHVCSMPGCGESTVGPSEETPASYSMTGIAAHISGAASGPGSRRYNPALTSEERRSIHNGIWLCCQCATAIDRDEATFTVEVLQDMKRRHEASRRYGPKGTAPGAVDDLIALGPSLICAAELTGAGPDGHRLILKHFLAGDPATLFGFVNDFDSLADVDRYALVNELGEGFMMRAAPRLERDGQVFQLTLPLAAAAARTSVHEIGTSLAQDATGDLFVADGSLARVSGLAAFPQRVSNLLGLAKGESLFHRTAGSRVAEFFRDFAGSPWLASLFKLEIIRLASVPITDPLSHRTATPLQCIARVRSVELPSFDLARQRLAVRLVLDLCGEGAWQGDVRVFIHTPEQLEKVGVVPDWLADALHAVPQS